MYSATKIRTHVFRLVPYKEYDAVTNMAVDEALLELHLQGKTPPTLRFYGWAPPAVSFGYGQKVDARTLTNIKAAGYDVVRRPTGGRAVLHEGELTYCFIASSRSDAPVVSADSFSAAPPPVVEQTDFDPASRQHVYESPYEPILESSVARAYRQICNALIAGLTELGVETSLGKTTDGSYKSYEDCFQATTQADLQFQGKKIVGSAQLRRRNAVMQHGSIILNQDQNRMSELLGEKVVVEIDKKRHFNLRDVLSSEVDRTAIEEAIGRGFTRAFNCSFAVYDLKEDEWQVVENLKSEGGQYQVQTITGAES